METMAFPVVREYTGHFDAPVWTTPFNVVGQAGPLNLQLASKKVDWSAINSFIDTGCVSVVAWDDFASLEAKSDSDL